MSSVLPVPGQYACVDIKGLKHFGIKFPNVMGWLINVFTNSKYNHAFIYVGNGKIVQAQPSGANIADLSEYDGDPLIWSDTPMTEDQKIAVIAAAMSCAGTPYGFLDIVYIGLARLGIKWNWLLKRVLSEKNMICSQLVAYSGDRAGITDWLCGEKYSQLVTPAELAIQAGTKGHLFGRT